MRCRLSLAIVALATADAVSATAVLAQQAGGGPEASREASSEMVGDTIRTEAAEVVVVEPPQASATRTGGSAGGGGGTGGGSSGDDSGSNGFEFDPDPGIPIAGPVLACFDEAAFEAGVIGTTDMAECLPDDEAADAGSAAEPVDPLVLALRALSEMRLPSPQPEMSPSLDEGTYAQLATFFYLQEWEGMSNSASAGSATSRATAVPVSHTWVITDTYGGASESIICEGPGAPFDPSRSYESQLPPECGWTPKHSSAGQSERGGTRDEPCFPTTVTQSWQVTWTSSIGAGGDLGVATTSTEVCLVVAELQALVTADGR